MCLSLLGVKGLTVRVLPTLVDDNSKVVCYSRQISELSALKYIFQP